MTVNELIQMVNVALDTAPGSSCVAGDANGDGAITINEIVAGVNNALNGCPSSVPHDRAHPSAQEMGQMSR